MFIAFSATEYNGVFPTHFDIVELELKPHKEIYIERLLDKKADAAAFEIRVDDQLVYSGLKEKRYPSAKEAAELILARRSTTAK